MLELENKTLQRIFNWGLIIVAGVLLVSFNYGDLIATTRHGINFWNILFNGRILNFYQDNIVPSGNLYIATVPIEPIYNFLVYFVFAVWNFPLWLLEKFAAVDVMNNFPCLVYMRLLPMCATILCAKIIGKILKETGASKERVKFTQYIYLSSTVILPNVLIVTRYDSLCSIFMLLSLLYYLRKDFGKFIFYSGISFCFNYFSLIMFFPLLLLQEKNFRKILQSFFLMILPYILTTIPFLGKTNSALSTVTFSYFLGLFSNTNGLFSWFIIFYAMIFVFSFLTDKEKSVDKNFVFWLSFVSITSIIAFCSMHPYRAILCVPFVSLLIGDSEPQKDILHVVLETIAMFGMVFGGLLRMSLYFIDTHIFQSMLMSFLINFKPAQVVEKSKIVEIYRSIPDTVNFRMTVAVVFHSFFVAGVLILAFLCFPNVDKILPKSDFCSSENKLSDVLLIRFIVMIGICFLPFVNLIK